LSQKITISLVSDFHVIRMRTIKFKSFPSVYIHQVNLNINISCNFGSVSVLDVWSILNVITLKYKWQIPNTAFCKSSCHSYIFMTYISEYVFNFTFLSILLLIMRNLFFQILEKLCLLIMLVWWLNNIRYYLNFRYSLNKLL
jgi:hypothetical protein